MYDPSSQKEFAGMEVGVGIVRYPILLCESISQAVSTMIPAILLSTEYSKETARQTYYSLASSYSIVS